MYSFHNAHLFKSIGVCEYTYIACTSGYPSTYYHILTCISLNSLFGYLVISYLVVCLSLSFQHWRMSAFDAYTVGFHTFLLSFLHAHGAITVGITLFAVR